MTNLCRTKARLASLRRTCVDDRGATAVEYAIMVALVAAVIIAAVMIMGQDVRAAFESVTKVWPSSP